MHAGKRFHEARGVGAVASAVIQTRAPGPCERFVESAAAVKLSRSVRD
jgi:hypothetical protein